MKHNTIKFFVALCLLSSPLLSVHADSWTSIQNNSLKIIVDPETGRFIVFDTYNTYPSYTTKSTSAPRGLIKRTSRIPYSEDIDFSPLLGQYPEAYNFAAITLDGKEYLFGTSEGRWVTPTTKISNKIISTWQIKDIKIQQILEFTNDNSSQQNAVHISYTAENLSETPHIITLNLVLDPRISDGLSKPFVLADGTTVSQEYDSMRNGIPEYWLSLNDKGSISKTSLKGYLQESSSIPPNRFVISTMEKIINDPWRFRSAPNLGLIDKDLGILLQYNTGTIEGKKKKIIASTSIAQNSSIQEFENKKLKIQISDSTKITSLPTELKLWLENTDSSAFSSVELFLENQLGITTEKQTVILSNIIPQTPYPISWNIKYTGTNSTVSVNINVKSTQGSIISEFSVPAVLEFDQNIIMQNLENQLLQMKKIAEEQANVFVPPPSPPKKKIKPVLPESILSNPNTINESYQITGDSLNELSQYLKQIENTNEYSNVLTLIEQEQKIISELKEIEQTINKVSRQHDILWNTYQRIYQDAQAIDKEQINLQILEDNLIQAEELLKTQEIEYYKILEHQ